MIAPAGAVKTRPVGFITRASRKSFQVYMKMSTDSVRMAGQADGHQDAHERAEVSGAVDARGLGDGPRRGAEEAAHPERAQGHRDADLRQDQGRQAVEHRASSLNIWYSGMISDS